MQFNVAQLLKQSVGTVRSFDIDETAPVDPDIRLVERLRGHVQFTRTGRGVLVRAQLESAASGTCGRCLADTRVPIHVRFEEEFLSTVDVISGLPTRLPAEEAADAFLIGAKHVLDLTEAIRQYALLDMPLQVVCDGACAGLCPRCGMSRNLGPCACPPEHVDVRWAKLSELHVDAPSERGRS